MFSFYSFLLFFAFGALHNAQAQLFDRGSYIVSRSLSDSLFDPRDEDDVLPDLLVRKALVNAYLESILGERDDSLSLRARKSLARRADSVHKCSRCSEPATAESGYKFCIVHEFIKTPSPEPQPAPAPVPVPAPVPAPWPEKGANICTYQDCQLTARSSGPKRRCWKHPSTQFPDEPLNQAGAASPQRPGNSASPRGRGSVVGVRPIKPGHPAIPARPAKKKA